MGRGGDAVAYPPTALGCGETRENANRQPCQSIVVTPE